MELLFDDIADSLKRQRKNIKDKNISGNIKAIIEGWRKNIKSLLETLKTRLVENENAPSILFPNYLVEGIFDLGNISKSILTIVNCFIPDKQLNLFSFNNSKGFIYQAIRNVMSSIYGKQVNIKDALDANGSIKKNIILKVTKELLEHNANDGSPILWIVANYIQELNSQPFIMDLFTKEIVVVNPTEPEEIVDDNFLKRAVKDISDTYDLVGGTPYVPNGKGNRAPKSIIKTKKPQIIDIVVPPSPARHVVVAPVIDNRILQRHNRSDIKAQKYSIMMKSYVLNLQTYNQVRHEWLQDQSFYKDESLLSRLRNELFDDFKNVKLIRKDMPGDPKYNFLGVRKTFELYYQLYKLIFPRYDNEVLDRYKKHP